MKVALHYQKIHDNLPEQALLPPNVHAIHIEVDKMTLQIQRESIGLIFSSKTKEFLVGIKMRLVPKISTGTDYKVCLKTKERQALQAHFLAISAIRLLLVTPHLDYNKHRTMATLWQFLLHNSLPTPPEMSLVLCHQPILTIRQIHSVVPTTTPNKSRPGHSQTCEETTRSPSKLDCTANTATPSPSPMAIPPLMPCPSKPAPKLEPTIASQQEALNKVFVWRFTVATENSQTILKSSFNCKH